MDFKEELAKRKDQTITPLISFCFNISPLLDFLIFLLFQEGDNECKCPNISSIQHVSVLQLENFQNCSEAFLAQQETKHSMQNFSLKLQKIKSTLFSFFLVFIILIRLPTKYQIKTSTI